MIRELKIPEKFREKMGVDSLSISGFKKGIIGQILKNTQQWEYHIQNVLGRILQPDDVFLDIGANVGIHTVFASKFVKEVIAIEPGKEIFKHLLKTVELNKCDNVTCHNIGLWDQDETRLFCHLPKQPGQSHFTSVDYHEPNAIKDTVEVRRLDNLILPHVDVVKIDVEGVEKFVLRGGARLFEKCPILFIELNNPSCVTNIGENIMGTLYQIMSFGYETIYYGTRKRLTHHHNQITLPPHRYAPHLVSWNKTDFDGLVKANNFDKMNSKVLTDAIFMPPGKMITGL